MTRKEEYAKHREEMLNKNREYRQNNKAKTFAKNLAYRHIPLKSSCELCPEDDVQTENLERHHPDYSEPLIVVTVCDSCHSWAASSGKKQKVGIEDSVAVKGANQR